MRMHLRELWQDDGIVHQSDTVNCLPTVEELFSSANFASLLYGAERTLDFFSFFFVWEILVAIR
jgi:hypothetical protein